MNSADWLTCIYRVILRNSVSLASPTVAVMVFGAWKVCDVANIQHHKWFFLTCVNRFHWSSWSVYTISNDKWKFPWNCLACGDQTISVASMVLRNGSLDVIFYENSFSDFIEIWSVMLKVFLGRWTKPILHFLSFSYTRTTTAKLGWGCKLCVLDKRLSEFSIVIQGSNWCLATFYAHFYCLYSRKCLTIWSPSVDVN